MQLEEVREQLKISNWKEVAEATQISYFVIRDIATDRTKKPSFENITEIIKYLEGLGDEKRNL